MPNYDFQAFVDITKRLRKECPWDREQTHDSIKHALIEETYEVVDAIDDANWDELKKELGDLLLHVVFHSNIAEENNEFTINEVIQGISDKMVRRHPHIYGDAEAGSASQVKQNWEKIKLSEGRESIIDGVPRHMPALLRAHRLQDKASKVGFDWKKPEDAWKKVDEELIELKESLATGNPKEIEAEYGDLLFALVNYSRFIHVNPENALGTTIDKFITRFHYIEKRLKEMNKDIHNSTLEEMDALWDEAKVTL